VTLSSLHLVNFRNYKDAEIHFSPGVNLLSGRNAEGKTNILEALFFLSTGRSFRTTHLGELIREGTTHFYLEAEFIKDGIAQTLQVSYDGNVRHLQHNATSYKQFTNLLGLLPHVLYTPDDIDLIRGAPSERRRFLDLYLSQIDPLYVHHWLRYMRAMKQRNCLLREQDLRGIESWETIMALSGAYLIEKREQAIRDLTPHVEQALRHFSAEQEQLSLHYQPAGVSKDKSEGYGERLLKSFAALRKKESFLGATLSGPHRDDIKLEISGKDVRAFASEGQKRSCIAALRLAQWRLYRALQDSPPLFSIDDFGVHLDTQRQTLLNEALGQLGGQIFLTSPFSSHAITAPAFALFHIEQGTISLQNN
jgi:DNA replication and repair protein RecF